VLGGGEAGRRLKSTTPERGIQQDKETWLAYGIIRRMASDNPPPAELEQTQPSQPASEPTQETQASPSSLRSRLWKTLRWFLFIIPAALIIAAAIGYADGVNQRDAEQQAALAGQADEQFNLGVDDLAAGRFEIARQRFEFVSRIDPNYPGVTDRLAETLLALNAPTETPTPVLTPTPNLAPVEDMLSQAKEAYDNQDWSGAIDTLIALRAKDPSFQAVQVDGLLYGALRARGLQHIREDWELELGLYDLARAESFGPLDAEAVSWRTSARLYLSANSNMGLNWPQATNDFLELCLAGLWDSCDKLSTAADAYADWMSETGDICAASEQYKQWGFPPDIPALERVYEFGSFLIDRCEELSAPPAPKPTSTAEGLPTPTETPAAEPTPTPEG
jgi:tetratricopeptide (TPR) repeat protein